MSRRILVVDDDPHIREVICFALANAGFAAMPADNGVSALAQHEREPADLIILDIGMPELDGLEVCRRIRRQSETPILFLSARGDEIDRVLGLELGGDDYVTKPFSPRELVARVSAILKRASITPTAAAQEEVLRCGALTLNAQRFQAAFKGNDVALTALEFALIKLFAMRPGIVFTRGTIMSSIYASNINVSDRTIDSHVRNIRSKFAAAGCENVIDTVHGVGFRLGAVTTE
ncbi:MAG: response regulator transcription factor [Proteobacteria bacterium]|nr:response regulator transcription factor [Pseudomonadota bacterium]